MKIQGHFMKIRTKLFLCMMALLIPTMIVVDIGVYNTYREDVESQVIQLADEVNTHMALNLRTTMKTLEENILYKIMACDIFGYQDHLQEASVFSIERKMVNFAALLESMKLSVESIYILDQWNCTFFCDDHNVLHEGYEEYKKSEAFQYIRDHIDVLKEQRGKTIWRRFDDSAGSIYMIKNVLDLSSLQYRGILCVQIGSDYIAEKISSETNETVLFDENGGLLYAEEGMTGDALAYKNGELDAGKYLVTAKTVPVKKWEIASFTPENKVLAKMSEFLLKLVAFEAFLFLLAALMAIRISGSITYNISALIDNFRKINRGEEAETVQYRSHDETAYLCEKFNDMNRELKHSIEQITLNSVQREKAEYNALMAQMNPHFLYNTLEAVSSMAKLRGQNEIVESIGKLSRLLRVSITTEDQEIPLQQELDYVEKYLELQNLISGGRINWELIREDGLEDCLVPKLFLQPLVENSIIHGVADMLEEAVIVILARRQEETLLIEISDNGKGIEQEKLDLLLLEDEPEDRRRDRAHIGIRSIQKRIWILYGREYGLDIRSSKEGTVVRVRLPLRREAEDGVD